MDYQRSRVFNLPGGLNRTSIAVGGEFSGIAQLGGHLAFLCVFVIASLQLKA